MTTVESLPKPDRRTPAADPVLSIRGLEIDFTTPDGINRGVRGLDLDVGPGEIVALVGETGSGKTATATAVLGLLPPSAAVRGEIRLGGRDVAGLSEKELRPLRGAYASMVFQEPSTALNPVQTIGWQLREALRAHGRPGGSRWARADARRRAVELLALVGIPAPEEKVRSYPHQLSGGQRQRVVIALALANESKLLIADEPTTALDVTVQAEILDLLRSLRSRLGTAILLITHNLGVVADLADRVVVLRQGVREEEGPVEQVFAEPEAEYTRSLLRAVPRLGSADPSAVPSTVPSAEPAGDPAVELRDVVARYPGRFGQAPTVAVDGVDLRLQPGEVLGVVGESGSGKSTIGRVVAGLLTPAAGSLSVLGQDLGPDVTGRTRRDRLHAARRHLGVVFQDPATSLDPRLTVEQSVAEPLSLHRVGTPAERRERVHELLDRVRLGSGHATRRPSQLSGGQRQRVALARALALGPKLLVADEPTSALDVSVQASVLQLFRELQADLGFAAIFISHDLAVVDEVASRVLVLRQGREVESGPAPVVLHTPSEAYTQALLDAVPIPDPVRQRERQSRQKLE